MINHVRTLLLNRNGNTGPGLAFPGAEYVPSAYRARTLPPYLEAAMRALFGFKPDPLYQNYRLWQLMQLLHSTELEEYVLAPDPRVTYLRDGRPYFSGVFGTTVEQYEGDVTPLYVSGTATPGVRCEWDVVVDGTTLSSVLSRPFQNTVDELLFDGGLSQPVQLPGSELKVRVHEDQHARFSVTAAERPAENLGEVLARLGQLLTPYQMTLFSVRPEEPYRTFQQVYTLHPLGPYKYSALLLALAYRIDELTPAGTAR